MNIFVYGTLKSNYHNHYILENCNAKFLSNVITVEKYPLFELKEPFPYLQNNPGIGEFVKGELYYVDNIFKEQIDYFEGVPTLYKNGKIKVTNGKEEYEVDCYFKSEEIISFPEFIEEY